VKFEDFWGTEITLRVQRANKRCERRLLAVQRLDDPKVESSHLRIAHRKLDIHVKARTFHRLFTCKSSQTRHCENVQGKEMLFQFINSEYVKKLYE
jgi:hypothetical protein